MLYSLTQNTEKHVIGVIGSHLVRLTRDPCESGMVAIVRKLMIFPETADANQDQVDAHEVQKDLALLFRLNEVPLNVPFPFVLAR